MLQRLGVQDPDSFPLVKAHIVYGYEARFTWGAVKLELLAIRYKPILHRDILYLARATRTSSR